VVDPRPRGAFRLLRVAGIPIYVHSSYLLLAVIIILGYGPLAQRVLAPLSSLGGYLVAAGFVVCLLVSVLLHELGHAVVARRQGIGVRAITLELLGGYTEMDGESPNPRADALVSLVGPAVSAVLGVIGLGLQWLFPHGIADQLAFQIAWSNLIVAAFNALPGLPLDGGRALRALIWKITGNRISATIAAAWAGRLVAVATIVIAIVFSYQGRTTVISVALAAFVALVVWQGATASIRQARMQAKLPTLDLRQLARPVVAVPSGTPVSEAVRRRQETGRPDAALAIADSSGRLIALAHDGSIDRIAFEQRPWVALDSVARTLDPGRTLAAGLAGEDVVAAVQAHPAPNYLVVAGDEVVGVLRTADLVRLLNS
jgi:Zn-dependent protease